MPRGTDAASGIFPPLLLMNRINTSSHFEFSYNFVVCYRNRITIWKAWTACCVKQGKDRLNVQCITNACCQSIIHHITQFISRWQDRVKVSYTVRLEIFVRVHLVLHVHVLCESSKNLKKAVLSCYRFANKNSHKIETSLFIPIPKQFLKVFTQIFPYGICTCALH